MSAITELQGIEKALIAYPNYAGLIVDGKKWMELRSRNVTFRGEIGIIAAGTGLIIGKANLHGVKQFGNGAEPAEIVLKRFHHAHRVDNAELLKKYHWAWFLKNAIRFDKPICYKHPQGAVVWVDLTKEGVL